MNKRTFVVSALGIVLLAGATAFAGAKSNFPLQVNTASRQAWGELGATRNSADGNAYFTCQIYTHYSSGADLVDCWGSNTAGTSFSCTSTDADIIAAARTIGSDDYVAIYWDSNSTCTALTVRKSSTQAPKSH